MKTLIEMILQEQKTTANLLAKSNRNVAKYKDLPDIHIQNATRKGYEQFYKYDANSKKKSYVKHEDLKQYVKLMQRDYELIVNRQLKHKSKLLDKIIKQSYELENDDIIGIYEKMPSLKKELIAPLIETDEQFVTKWMELHPGQQNTFPEDGIYKTNRGEMVRSKSEKIIADALEKHNIQYQYEPLLELGYVTVHPDFVVLNMRTKQTLYWEHLGLVSDMEYATKNFVKLQNYEKSGYLLGRDLITTMESVDVPLDIKLVEEKIKEHLL
jgi:hypothetical protein